MVSTALLSDSSSLSSASASSCLSSASSVCWRMLLSIIGTLVQRCIGEISRSVSCRRRHRESCSHHCYKYTHTHTHTHTLYIQTLGLIRRCQRISPNAVAVFNSSSTWSSFSPYITELRHIIIIIIVYFAEAAIHI